MEPQGGIHHRRALHAGLAGPMLEVGAGNGFTFANYSPVVTDTLAVAPEPYPRALARAAAAPGTRLHAPAADQCSSCSACPTG
jgi:hypothetical protein